MTYAHTAIIETQRLVLRRPQMDDALDVQRMAGAWEVAETTGVIPHPYEDGMAESWIQNILDRDADNPNFTFAMIRREDNQLVGVCSFHHIAVHEKAEIGYWVGKPYWNHGYASEATRALVDYCFANPGLNKVYAAYYATNIASRRVMEKAGMVYEGTLRQFMVRAIPSRNHHAYHDVGFCGILRAEWDSTKD